MSLILKGFIIGIGKIIPGVSGALLAINMGVYERMINAITNFFSSPKDNFKTLFLLGIGIISSIIFFSSIILYLLNNYYNYIMIFFLGLIVSSTYKYAKDIKYSWKRIIFVIIFSLLIVLLPSSQNNYIIKENFSSYIMFFISGVIEIFTSIVPGISGTAMLMNLGMYNHILNLISMLYNVTYVLDNLGYYISYGLGMFVSLTITLSLINYMFSKKKYIMEIIILSLSIGSIILLFNFISMELSLIFFGLLFIGLFLGYKC